jgi:arylsulfatase
MRYFWFLILLTLPLAAAPPNILFIIDDDMGVSDLGCYGGEIETPHLDGLARNGLRFTNYYVHNMCWPTRASIMTGLYPKTALPANGSANGGLHPEATTLPQALRDSGYATFMAGKWHLSNAGYATFMAGKWHLSNAAQPDGPHAPHNRGFDHFYGTIYGASDFFAPSDLQLDGKDMTHEWKDNGDYFYSDAIADYTLKFLKDHADGANKAKPFFMYMAFTSAHWPLHAKPKDIAHYKGKYSMGWDKLREQRHARMKAVGVVDPDWPLSPRHPDVPAWADEKDKAWQERRMEVYAAQVTNMDWNIGRVISYLKETGQFDNTLIVYQHDNGGCHVEYTTKRKGSWSREFTTDGKKLPIKSGNIPGLMPGPQTTFQSYGYGWANASNTPYRLFKSHDHQGGTLSPLIVSWPKGLAGKLAGGISHEVCHVVDIMPTLLTAAGAPLPTQKPMALEGRSFLPVLHGEPEKRQRQEAIYWAHAKGRAIRTGEWRMVRVGNEPWELYNIVKDGTELNNLADKMPEKVEQLKGMHAAWEKRTNLGKAKPKKPKKKK